MHPTLTRSVVSLVLYLPLITHLNPLEYIVHCWNYGQIDRQIDKLYTLPWQDLPFPSYPPLHTHLNPLAIGIHCALRSQSSHRFIVSPTNNEMQKRRQLNKFLSPLELLMWCVWRKFTELLLFLHSVITRPSPCRTTVRLSLNNWYCMRDYSREWQGLNLSQITLKVH